MSAAATAQTSRFAAKAHKKFNGRCRKEPLDWERHFPEATLHQHAQEFQKLRANLNKVSESVEDAITRGLNLIEGQSTRKGLQACCVELRHQRFLLPGARDQLRRLLAAFSLKHRHIGFNKDFAILSSLLMVYVETEHPNYSDRAAYSLVAATFERFRLAECYLPDLMRANHGPDVNTLQDDVACVLSNYRDLCPAPAQALVEHRCCSQLSGIVSSWLCTLLASAFNPDFQSWESFLPLVDRIMTGPSPASDPREHLRHVIVCALVAQSPKILQAAKECQLQECLQELSLHLPVNSALLSLIDEKLNVERCITYHRACYVPFGMLAGFCGGAQLGAAASLGVAGAAGILGPLGLVAGGVATFLFAKTDGCDELEEAIDHFMRRGDFLFSDDVRLEDDGTMFGESLSQISTRHGSVSAQTGIRGISTAEPVAEEDEEDEDLPELDFDFFLGGHDAGIGEKMMASDQDADLQRLAKKTFH